MDAITAEGLGKVYVGPWRPLRGRVRTPALVGLDLAVRPGEIVGLLGANGAGKSTAIKLIVGLVRPSAGAVRVFGAPPSARAARERLGYAPELPRFHPRLRVRELMDMAGSLCGLARAGRRAQAAELLARLGLAEATSRPVGALSKGQRQRLALAQALVGAPALLVLDEPMSGLDPPGREAVARLLAEARGRGAAVLFSTHALAEAERLCDRAAVLAGGRLRALGTIAALAGEDEVEVRWTSAPADAAALRAAADELSRETGPKEHGEGDMSEEAMSGRLVGTRAAADRMIAAVVARGGRVVAVQPRGRGLAALLREEPPA